MSKLGIVLALSFASMASQTTSDRIVTLTGLVVDADSALPLNRVIVSVRSGTRAIAVQSTITGPDGRFSLHVAAGPAALSVWGPGHETRGQSLLISADLDVHYRLRPDRPIRGQIINTTGRPLRHARVRLVPLRPVGLTQIVEGMTRIDGAYDLRGSDQSQTYRLEAAHPGCEWTALRTSSVSSLAGVERRDVVRQCR